MMKFIAKVPRQSVQLDLDRIAAELRANPGQWGVIENGPRNRLNGKAGWWRRMGTHAFPVGQFEFTIAVTKKQPKDADRFSRRVKLLGRFVGESLQTPPPTR